MGRKRGKQKGGTSARSMGFGTDQIDASLEGSSGSWVDGKFS